MEFALFCNRNKTIPNLAKQQLGELINTLMPYFVPLFFFQEPAGKRGLIAFGPADNSEIVWHL